MPAPGGEDHRERNEPYEPEPRAHESDDDEQEREVVQPDDGRQRERCPEREHERTSFIPSPADDDHRRQERETAGQPDRTCKPVRKSDVESNYMERVRVLPDRVLQTAHEFRVVGEAGEPDGGPRDDEEDEADRDRERGGCDPPRRGEPHGERPQEELRSEGHADKRRRHGHACPEPPHERRAEPEQERDVPGLDRG